MHRFTKLIVVALLAVASGGSALAIGAIAVDDYYDEDPSEAGYGIATEYRSAREASAAALDACTSEQNSDCKVVLTFKKCGAYAASQGGYGVGSASTRQAAEKRALRQCGDANCIVVVSDCDK
jgi:hypothetical protein